MLFVSMTTALLAACVIYHRLDAAVLSATTEARRMVWGRLMTVVLHLQSSQEDLSSRSYLWVYTRTSSDWDNTADGTRYSTLAGMNWVGMIPSGGVRRGCHGSQ